MMMLTAWINVLRPYGAIGPRRERENPLPICSSKHRIHLISYSVNWNVEARQSSCPLLYIQTFIYDI